jgi:hypothetical protein
MDLHDVKGAADEAVEPRSTCLSNAKGVVCSAFS